MLLSEEEESHFIFIRHKRVLRLTQMNFSDLGLDEVFLKRLAASGIESPTAIQQSLFTPIMEGESILGLAKTGTGKTLSYLGPIVQKLERKANQNTGTANDASGPSVVVLVPTRELASQVQSTHFQLTENSKGVAVVVGGEAEEAQIDAAGQAEFVIATPGRLLDLLKRKKIATQQVGIVVMDEADRLLDMGFVDDIRAIMKFLPKAPQLICVSATLHLGVEEVAYEMGLQPKRFGIEEEEATVSGLQHRLVHLGDSEKFHALANFIYERKDKRGIVFSNYRDKAHELSSRLKGLGCRVDALSAQLSQGQRKRITEAYRSEKTKVLVASDLAARGLDFLDIDYVVNYDLPEDPATYVHRVGRTARAGKEGTALSLVGFEDAFRVEKLERFLGEKIESYEMSAESFEGALPRFGPRIEEEDRPRSRHKGSDSRYGNRKSHAKYSRNQEQPQRNSSKGPSKASSTTTSESSFQERKKTAAAVEKKGFFHRLVSRVLKVFAGTSKTSALESSGEGRQQGRAPSSSSHSRKNYGKGSRGGSRHRDHSRSNSRSNSRYNSRSSSAQPRNAKTGDSTGGSESLASSKPAGEGAHRKRRRSRKPANPKSPKS